MDDLARQIAICALHGSDLVATAPEAMVGLARATLDGRLPLNGLRHPIEGRASGWYFWAGEEFPLEDDAFLPMHAEHLRDYLPDALPYLGLAPGWRFLLAPDYCDVWFDPQLFDI
jgi:hypothetical protein